MGKPPTKHSDASCRNRKNVREGPKYYNRAGNFEVIQVIDREKNRLTAPGYARQLIDATPHRVNEQEATARELFAHGVRDLEEHRAKDAFDVFSVLTDASRSSAYLALYRGIALSFGASLTERYHAFLALPTSRRRRSILWMPVSTRF